MNTMFLIGVFGMACGYGFGKLFMPRPSVRGELPAPFVELGSEED